MRHVPIIRFSWISMIMVVVAVACATVVRAGTPSCADVSGIATCTCICDEASFTPPVFSGCQGLDVNTVVPTPNQCPDMLQGRSVISGGEWVLVSDPTKANAPSDTSMVAQLRLYQTMNSTNPGLGEVDGTPVLSSEPSLPCRPGNGIDIAFPMQSRLARLFDLPYDVMVTLQPSADSSQVDTDCFATDMSALNMNLITSSAPPGAAAVPILAFEANPQWVQLAIADVNYDGFDDIVVVNLDSIQTFTAVDTSDPTQGLARMSSALTESTSGAFKAPINEPATGDFNGDGLIDVAWIGGDFPNHSGNLSVFFATICPGAVTNTICAGATPFQIMLDPAATLFPKVSGATSTIVLPDDSENNTGTSLEFNKCSIVETGDFIDYSFNSLRAGAIAVGNFQDNGETPRGAPVDELIVAYVQGSGANHSCDVFVQEWSYEPPTAGQPVWAGHTTPQSLLIGDSPDDYGQPAVYAVFAQAAYLDWYGPTEQAVIGSVVSRGTYRQDAEGNVTLGGLSEWTPTVVSISDGQVVACNAVRASDTSAFPYVWGTAVGRFSTSTTVNGNACDDFADAAPGDCPYNPQIAMLLAHDSENNTGNFPPTVWLYSVQQSQPNGSDDALKCANDHSLLGFLPVKYAENNLAFSGADAFHAMPPATLRAGSQLRAGDAFGNSVRVGNPTITRITAHTQPQMVIETPPSLIDYVLPNETNVTSPAIVNFTRTPGDFYTQIQFATENSDTSATSLTTSYSTSTTESVGAEVKLKVPLIAGIDAKNTESWSQFYQHTTSSQLNNYVSTGLETNVKADFDDQIWWTQTAFNVFHFPVIGQTVCPASLTCDVSDPNNIVCGGSSSTANTVELTCAEDELLGGGICQCLSTNASASLCPENPTDVPSCAQQGNDVCCSQLPQQLYMTMSGPEEVTRESQSGATAEFYHPKHEPGQILSYPANLALLEARLSNPQSLATLTTFSTGRNATTQTINYEKTCTDKQGIGTTTRHSFESDTSLTAGTPNLSDAVAGVNVTGSFDYNHSSSIDTLNSYTVGQTESSSVQLNLDGMNFLDPGQYEYGVAGIVYGQKQPDDVLDIPDLQVCPVSEGSQDSAVCSDADKVSACQTTTGPLQVAYTADPTAGGGLWWSSAAPYLREIDVALNNPSRWVSAQPDQVANMDLQCRGGTCYTINQPPVLPCPPPVTDASCVWDHDFFDLKGLLVTNGGTAGPQRDTAMVGDEIFLQVRVSNYSLMATDVAYPGSTVYARIYRQQLDVNNTNGSISIVDYATDADGNTFSAVPIGPNGLGDSTPIPVVSPAGDSGSIPGFNTTGDSTTNPADTTKDNISIATTSYTATADDTCEFPKDDAGVVTPVCIGAYYVYWVTVWIQDDATGAVLAELPGHGLATTTTGSTPLFNPSTAYHFITDVPLETVTFNNALTTFSNNVGMFKKVFTILPPPPASTGAASTGTVAATEPGVLALDRDRLSVTPARTVLGKPVVVATRVMTLGAATPGPTVVFWDGDPQQGGTVFDTEWLPHIRANDAHFVRANYLPQTCGTHTLVVNVAAPLRGVGDQAQVDVEVGIDVDSTLAFLITEVQGLGLKKGTEQSLLAKLQAAQRSFGRGNPTAGRNQLQSFVNALQAQSGKQVPTAAATRLSAQAEQIMGCV